MRTRSQSFTVSSPAPIAGPSSSSGLATSQSQSTIRRRLSPPSHVPRIFFNGVTRPLNAHTIQGSTFGIYFGLDRAVLEKTRFDSLNTRPSAPSHLVLWRFIEFRSKFSSAFDADDLFVVLVVVGTRRYVIGGTYDPALKEENMSLKQFGCEQIFKGDVGVCFLGKQEPQKFLESIPRLRNVDDGIVYLRRALDSYIKNVANHVERHAALKDVVRGYNVSTLYDMQYMLYAPDILMRKTCRKNARFDEQWTWYRNQPHEFYRYVRDEKTGMVQKLYDDPHLQSNIDKTIGLPNPKKGILNHGMEAVNYTSRKATPVSFEPLEIAPKYFMDDRVLPIMEGGTYGPTKLQSTNFNSKDSQGITAWHYSQSPFDLNFPLPETPMPSKLGTIYIHRNATDGGYQVWVWLIQGDQKKWQPVDLSGPLVHHPEIPSRVLTLQTSTGNPSWVLHSTLITTQGRHVRRRRSQSRTRSKSIQRSD
ncbi:hypothetical protein GGU10DRAFT_335662 [Lentinula aff. detonsa]|uniref:Uncharacterized protein n=1 Tax=Lentinula aff. detonsa TaxID=2804958 RepID=A0AA38KMJ5_9AGAR|nr:hypothetical protein GGU10DRAFT_335662 [Lentinula aff. detonsa]